MRFRFIAGVLLAGLLPLTVHATLVLKVTGVQVGDYTFIANQERLSTLLMKATGGQELWSLGASLQTPSSDQTARKQRDQILTTLNRELNHSDQTFQAQLLSLKKQVQALPEQGRMLITLDLDRVRIDPALDPMIGENAHLHLPKRPNEITLFGMLEHPRKLAFVAGQSVADYLDDVRRTAGADRSYLYLIQVDGHIEKAPVAYWNRLNRYITPGGVVFVPLAGERFEDLNQQIAQLLARQIRT